MDREHIKGTADKAKGAIKDTAGKVTGDKKLQTEGKMDKAKGSAHNVAGDIKDAVKDANDASLHAFVRRDRARQSRRPTLQRTRAAGSGGLGINH